MFNRLLNKNSKILFLWWECGREGKRVCNSHMIARARDVTQDVTATRVPLIPLLRTGREKIVTYVPRGVGSTYTLSENHTHLISLPFLRMGRE